MDRETFSVEPAYRNPLGLAELEPKPSNDALVRVRRPDGSEFLLRVPGEHLQRVMDLACGEFGDPGIQLDGPVIPKE